MATNKGAKETGEGDVSDLKHAISSAVTVANEAIKASPKFAVFVLMILVLSIFPPVLAIVLFVKEKYGLGVGLIAGSYAAILIIGYMIYSMIRRQDQTAAPPPVNALEVHWSRPMLKMPWSNNKLGDMAGAVEAIRNKAYTYLSGEAQIAGILADDIRANVFLPDYTKTSNGEVCLLVMAPTLCLGMNGCPDENLTLRIDQGMTGKVYKNQKDQLVGSVLSALGRGVNFHDTYALTADQKKLIHPDLKWIVSSPLNIQFKGKSRAIGVFNIDGLKHDVPTNILEILAARILSDVMALAEELSRQPIVESVVGVRIGE